VLNEVIDELELFVDVEHIDEIFTYYINVIYVAELYVILDELELLLDVIENFIFLRYYEMPKETYKYYIYIRD